MTSAVVTLRQSYAVQITEGVRTIVQIININSHRRRYRWPRGLRRRSVAARILRMWVPIPPGAWMTVVSVVCCQIEVFATS